MKFSKDLQGLRFNRLQVIKKIGKTKHLDSIWECLCDCGILVNVTRNHLTRQNTKSCGCLNRETRVAQCKKRNTTHGKSHTRTYNQWSLMKRRCLDNEEKNPDWMHYAGRGIKICPEWQNFEEFFHDMGESSPEYELERIDNDGNYEPGNCIWATRTEQTRNTRRNRYYCLDGQTLCLSEIAERYKINYNTLRSRVYIMGLSIEEAITYVNCNRRHK